MTPLTSASHDWTVESLVSQVARGRIVPAPALPYSTPWDEAEMVRFVESAVAGIPLGQVTVRGHKGPLSLVDGARRVSALCLFHGVVPPWPHAGAPGFALRGATMFRAVEGCTAETLPRDLRTALDNAAIRVVAVLPEPWADEAALRGRVHRPG